MHLEPIGYLRSSERLRFEVARQACPGEAVIELLPGLNLDQALADLEGFSRIWLVWWFHLNQSWRPKVQPPRGGSRKGVLATRSPHRPNPLGMSAVPLLKVSKLKLWIGAHDLVDGTPILDIKPYLPRYDSFPDEKEGWLETMPEPTWQVVLDPALEDHPDAARVRAILSENPLPHHRRRITALEDGRFRLASGPWRFFFQRNGEKITVESVLFQGSALE